MTDWLQLLVPLAVIAALGAGFWTGPALVPTVPDGH
jgi:hypothetical protein